MPAYVYVFAFKTEGMCFLQGERGLSSSTSIYLLLYVFTNRGLNRDWSMVIIDLSLYVFTSKRSLLELVVGGG